MKPSIKKFNMRDEACLEVAGRHELESYTAGTWGASAADLVLERDGLRWFPE